METMMAKTATTPSVQQTRNRIRNEVEREILTKYQAEVYALLEEKYEAAGLTYTRRLTAEEREQRQAEAKRAKAQAKLQALLAENPDLIDTLREQEAEADTP